MSKKKELIAKKAKSKCGVRGCSNTGNVYALSRTRESGYSVIICDECIKEAGGAIKAADNIIEKKKSEPRAIFFSAGVKQITNHKEQSTNDKQGVEGEEKFICKYCGKVCAKQIGLVSHEKACAKNNS